MKTKPSLTEEIKGILFVNTLGRYSKTDPHDVEQIAKIAEAVIAQTQRDTAEDICKITDDIELSYRDTSLEEWKAFKRIRNAIRDKYVFKQQTK